MAIISKQNLTNRRNMEQKSYVPKKKMTVKKGENKNTSQNNQIFQDFSNIKMTKKDKLIKYTLYTKLYFSFVKNVINYLVISYLTITINLKSSKFCELYSYTSTITIKIIGPGKQSIFSTEFLNKNNKPKYIYINKTSQENINNNYDLKELKTLLKWYGITV